ncbi:type IV toxin-antitoxin system AbiEi family antitoxin domain-containing protein [Amycolatopsis aidingensis]|uniref:type IV toxin-antitoxin system AbiEi family antitoxin domain-containing protein n=1 Tax=Amycolatopsis aidingensis TaxID=2842453 RepID=UPI001C0DF2BA|nr:type IV toxin-antitoxin system AbiEi family antitoxin domain-containing protein [Amycolatopsis aidingensis]
MDRMGALALLAEYTAQQWGLVTTAQAVRAGVDTVTLTRLADAGHLQSVRRGVYALDAAPESRLREEQAVWLWLNPSVPAWERPKLDPDGGVLSHASATIAHDVGDLVADTVELTVPRRRTTRDPAVKLHRDEKLTDDDVVLIDGLPVTSARRTVLDLLAQHTDASRIAQVIRDGTESDRLDLDELSVEIGPYARRYGLKTRDGRRLLEHLLATIDTTPGQLTRRPMNPAAPMLSPARLTALAQLAAGSTAAVRGTELQRLLAKLAASPSSTKLVTSEFQDLLETVQGAEIMKALTDSPLTRQIRELNHNLAQAVEREYGLGVVPTNSGDAVGDDRPDQRRDQHNSDEDS